MPQKQVYGRYLAPEVQNLIRLTLSFAKAVGAHQQDKSDNLIVSPYNHLRFLSMVAKGTGGETREEMAQVLFNVDGSKLDGEIDKLITLNKTILEANKDKVTVKTATGMWVNSDISKLKAEYAQAMEELFETKITNKSFAANPTLHNDANQWASDSTKEKPTDEKGLITHIVDKFDNDMVIFLASALYFKGMWTKKFDPKLTEQKEFNGDDKVSLTKLMKQNYKEGAVSYQEGDDYEAIALTYGEQDYQTGKYPSMRIVLVRPTDPNQSARDWMAEQADGTVPAWLDPYAYQGARGTVEMPYMDMKQTHNLIPPLRDVGLKSMLGCAPDFSRMVENAGNLEFSFIKEDIVFKTDENGSEAASIVSGGIRTTSVHIPPPPINVKLDRSFVLAVQDIESGAPIFVGAVNKPNKAMTPVPKP